MIAIWTYDGDGYRSIIGIVSDKTYVSEYINKCTGFKDEGYVEYNSDTDYDSYWCTEFDKDLKGILLDVNNYDSEDLEDSEDL